ncbi:MAG: hypothetical protein QXS20_10305 [Candidatus Thorarchaeota archaeon]
MKPIKTIGLFLALCLVFTVGGPMLARETVVTPQFVVMNDRVVHSSSGPHIGTIEGITTEIDAWGGVTASIVTLQNMSHYNHVHIGKVTDKISAQLSSKDGFVATVTFSLSGLTPYPNGVVGPPIATLDLVVLPVVIVPAVRTDVYVADLTTLEAIQIADEIVSVYEGDLNINLERLWLSRSTFYTYFDYGVPQMLLEGNMYRMQYVAQLSSAAGSNTVSAYRSILAQMGGFMSIAGGTDWNNLLTTAAEMVQAAYWLPDYCSPSGFMVSELLESYSGAYLRADPVHTDLVTEVQYAAIGVVGFTQPGVVQAVDGDETYAIADHLGFTGPIKNKMQEDPSCQSLSVVMGFAPGSLSIDGIPSQWYSIDDQYRVPEEIELPGGVVIPPNSTLSEIVRLLMTYMPIEIGLLLNEEIGSIDPTAFDEFVDYLWGGGATTFPNMSEWIHQMNFSEIETAVEEMNLDLLASLMAGAGMNPNALMDRIDDTLYSQDPIAALVKAFFDYFDYYHVFDILDNDTYPNMPSVNDYFSTLGNAVKQFLKDFAGFDLPSEFSTKAEFAAFVQQHWEISLQAIFTAMTSNDAAALKTAIQNALNVENLQQHITPYLMADLGSSMMNGIGFAIAINTDFSSGVYGLLADDLVFTFEAELDSLVIDGPFLSVTKIHYIAGQSGTSAASSVKVGDKITFNITVKNYGSETAYNVKVLDGMSAGLDGDREFYWTRASLAPGASWVISFEVDAVEAGLFMDYPVICVYFNASLSEFDPSDPMAWGGTARYTTSARGYMVMISTPNWWEGTIFGIPTLYVVAGIAGAAVAGVAILLIRRR